LPDRVLLLTVSEPMDQMPPPSPERWAFTV